MTCSLRTTTDRFKENYSIDTCVDVAAGTNEICGTTISDFIALIMCRIYDGMLRSHLCLCFHPAG